MKQGALFDIPQGLPAGMVYQPDFISVDEEAALLEEIQKLPLQEAKYKEYTAKRRILSYGASYDFSSNELIPAGPIPPFLHPLRERAAAWVKVPAARFTHALIAEYQAGAPLGWHRDVPDFELIVGISLAGACRMRLRRYPPQKGRGSKSLAVELEPRSVYVMRGEARWGWQHSLPAVKRLRYSITFRTRSKTKSYHEKLSESTSG